MKTHNKPMKLKIMIVTEMKLMMTTQPIPKTQRIHLMMILKKLKKLMKLMKLMKSMNLKNQKTSKYLQLNICSYHNY